MFTIKKLYTYSYNKETLKELSNKSVFSSEEHALAEQKEFGFNYQTKENLLRYYLPEAMERISQSQFLIDLILDNNHQNIISFGAGAGVKEYLLKLVLPQECNVVSTDFDPFIINKVKKYFPQMIVKQFDYVNEDIEKFQKKINMSFDVAIFMGSSYVMDDKNFIKVFKDLKKIGVKNIVDFNAGFISMSEALRYYFLPETIRQNRILRKILRKKEVASYHGKFHGYGRTKSALGNLYKKSGWKVKEDSFKDPDNKYIALLS